MLTLEVPDREYFNEGNGEFVTITGRTLKMEHSLLSLSKWEEKWHEPFLGRVGQKTEHTPEQIAYYMSCMVVGEDIPPSFFEGLSSDLANQIRDYIDDPHTATTFYDPNGQKSQGGRKQTVTAELIYYWMFRLDIPIELQSWNLNRLMTLIRVCEIQDKPKKGNKIPRSKLAAQRSALNAQRMAQLGTTG